MSSKRPPAPPPEIQGFRYLSLLGSGGFSDVYLYEQDRPRRRVAVKVLLSDLRTEGARRRFESEANLMAQLSSHPYIVTIYEADVTSSGHSYLAMEYCSRPSLDVRYRKARFSVDEVLAIGVQVASAVETAHRAGIVHRDIKPANILVTDYNRPALTDFGISGTIDAAGDDDAGMSIPWSPPESFSGAPVDGVRVDVWALGATLYTLLAGRSPFVLPGADNSQRELINRIGSMPLPPLGRADVPESLQLALATAMSKSAASRYPSAHALALGLQRVQAELNLSVTPFEILQEPAGEEPLQDDGAEETRVRSVVSIDPETGHSPRTYPKTTFPERQRTFPAPAAPGPAIADTPPPLDDESEPTVLRGRLSGPGGGRQPAGKVPDRSTQPDRFIQRDGSAERDGSVEQDRSAERDEADVVATTVGRPALSAAAEAEQPVAAGSRNRRLAIAGAAVLAAAVGVGILVSVAAPPTPKPAQTISQAPPDALGEDLVPGVKALAGKPGPGGVVFNWTNPDPKAGDRYQWRPVTATSEGDYRATDKTTVTVATNPSGSTCIQVQLVRSDGRASGEQPKACYPQ